MNDEDLERWLELFGDDVVRLRYVDLAGDYEGSGCAIATLADGSFSSAEYSHCSCDSADGTMSTPTKHATYEEARRSIGEWQLEDLDKSGDDWQSTVEATL